MILVIIYSFCHFLERVQTVFGNGKRKFDNDVNNLEDELESNKENRVENGERIADAAKLLTKGIEQENESETYSKVRNWIHFFFLNYFFK